jgi:hypothetical protein
MAGGFVLVGQTMVLFAVGPSLTTTAAVVVATIIAVLILGGSRFAWAVALIGVGGRLVSSVISAGDYGALSVDGIAAICLLAPPSVRYVWSQRSPHQAGKLQLAVKKPYERVMASAYGVLASVAEWENGHFETNNMQKQRSYKVLLWRLGVACVLLFVLFAVAYNWQQGSGQGSIVVNLIASVTRICYVLVQVTFIAVVFIAVFSRARVTSRGL